MSNDLIDEKPKMFCYMAKSSKGKLAPFYCGVRRSGVWSYMEWNTSRTKGDLQKSGWSVVKCEVREL